MTYPLGSHKQYDDRSRNFQIRPLLTEAMGRQRRSRGWRPGVTLDQSPYGGACEGFATGHRLAATPIRQTITPSTCDAIYKLARELDGEDWDEGTSTLAAMQAARKLGRIAEFRWIGAGSGDVGADLVDTLGYVGGIVLGVPWYWSMFTPRPSGLLEVDPTSGLAGYHAIYTTSLRLKAVLRGEGPLPKEIVVLQQSWGYDWGVADFGQPGGFCYVSLDECVIHLLANGHGEGAVPLEVRYGS